MKGMPFRLIVICIVFIVLWLVKTVYNYYEESEIREKEEERILALQIQYNVIHEAREKLKDYYDNLTYIRYDIEKCLTQRGYSDLVNDRSVKKKDYDECTKIAHIVNKVDDIEEIQILALKPFPKEIDQYRPF